MKFGFVAKHRGAWPVNLMCEAHKLRQLLKFDAQYGCQVIGSLDEALTRFPG